ncbi:MAG TPA: hypothetical protein VGQ46_23060 [Thermoanaerobaculia bacterium]|jgi:hypothetical protein|nr:hypothetical protein [Thermoanaerobaculia bacterium]
MERISDQRIVDEEAAVAGAVFTPYEKIVAEIITSIDEGVAQLPGYNDDLSDLPRNLRRLVTMKFLDLTVNALDASSELQGVNQLDIMECRDTIQYSQALKTLIAHLRGVTSRLELLSRSRDARVGRSALRIYHIAKRIASDPDNTHVKVHVERLKAEMQRSRLKRRAKAGTHTAAAPEDVPSTPMP